MACTQTLTYPDTLFFEVLLRKINEAERWIEIATFVFNTSYGSDNRA